MVWPAVSRVRSKVCGDNPFTGYLYIARTVAASDSIDFPSKSEVRGSGKLTYINDYAPSNHQKCTHIKSQGRLPDRGLPVFRRRNGPRE